MPDSSMAQAIRESHQPEFPHGLYDFCTDARLNEGETS
jgi:hypothetical protein